MVNFDCFYQGVSMKALAVTVLGLGMSAAISGSLTTQIPGSLWVANDNSAQVAIGPIPVGNTTPAQPSWAVVQWSTRDPLYSPGPFKYPYNSLPYSSFSGSNDNWLLSNSTAAVKYDKVTAPWLNGVYTLALNGVPTLACGDEYDLFLQPKTDSLNSYGPNANGAPLGLTNSKPLSQLTALQFNLGAEITYESITYKCPNQPISDYNNASYTLGIVLQNSQTNKFFFYQITFRDARINDPNDLGDDFAGFTDGVSVGVGDSIRRISPNSQILKPNGGRVAYGGIDILPRLKTVISRGWIQSPGGQIFNFSGNLSEWRVKGVFIGNIIYGGATVSSSWDNFSLVETP